MFINILDNGEIFAQRDARELQKKLEKKRKEILAGEKAKFYLLNKTLMEP